MQPPSSHYLPILPYHFSSPFLTHYLPPSLLTYDLPVPPHTPLPPYTPLPPSSHTSPSLLTHLSLPPHTLPPSLLTHLSLTHPHKLFSQCVQLFFSQVILLFHLIKLSIQVLGTSGMV